MARLAQTLQKHPLIRTLLDLKGNQRACAYTEPLWGIPYNLYAPYITLYMYALGVGDTQIGLLLSIGMILQAAFSLLGGVLIDKMGRRLSTLVFDILCWTIPCLIWMVSHSFAGFLLAAVFNSMWKITDNSWTCLLTEDADPRQLVDIFTWVTIAGLLAVFFAPISSGMVAKMGVVPTMRILYFLAFIMMTAKFIILYIYSTETQQGLKRMAETQSIPLHKMLFQYKDVFLQILKSPATRLLIAILTLFNISTLVTGNFFALYITENLKIPDSFVALFPMIRAAVMLLFIFTIQGRLNRLPYRPIMISGLVLYFLSHLLLLIAPVHNIWLLIGFTLCDAFAFALFTPRSNSLIVLCVDKKERSRIVSLIFVMIIAIAAPFGWAIGRLSSIDRRLPFMLNLVVFAIMILLIAFSGVLRRQDQENSEE